MVGVSALPGIRNRGKYFGLFKLQAEHEHKTLFARAAGPSRINDDIDEEDLIVEIGAKLPHSGYIVVAVVDGEHTFKALHPTNDMCMPKAGNPDHPDSGLCEGQILEIWGERLPPASNALTEAQGS